METKANIRKYKVIISIDKQHISHISLGKPSTLSSAVCSPAFCAFLSSFRPTGPMGSGAEARSLKEKATFHYIYSIFKKLKAHDLFIY